MLWNIFGSMNPVEKRRRIYAKGIFKCVKEAGFHIAGYGEDFFFINDFIRKDIKHILVLGERLESMTPMKRKVIYESPYKNVDELVAQIDLNDLTVYYSDSKHESAICRIVNALEKVFCQKININFNPNGEKTRVQHITIVHWLIKPNAKEGENCERNG